MSSSMSTTSERDFLLQCLEGEDLPGPDSLGLVEDLVPEEHPPSRSAAAQPGSHGSRPDSAARAPVPTAPSPPAAAEASLSRAFSSPADAAPAALCGIVPTANTKQLRTSSTGAQTSSHTAAWLQQMDAVGTLTQASEVSVPAQSGPTYRPTLNTAMLPRAEQQTMMMENAKSGPLLEAQQQPSQQNIFQQSVGTPGSSTAAAAARARAANQQRSASLDLLSPSAAQTLFPTITAPQPDPMSSLARLTPEQYQMFVNSGIDPALAAGAPAATPTSMESQLDTAEALWQQIAASGADDQTLISLAVSLGLITTDAAGNMVLAREARQMRTPQLRNPLLAPQGLQGLYGNILDAAAAAAASPRLQGASDSAPLPRLPHSALAGLLGVYGNMRLSTASTPGNASKQLGSPGPGPSKQHTLYKTELCRGWLEAGTCRYGSKCQFAHGPEELRPVPRHPKYKTEVCRSFTATGVCAYGPRCRFIHGTMSAPTNVLEQPGSARLPEGLEGLEGVLSFEDVSPTQGPVLDSRRANMVSPNHSLLTSLAGPSMALRQAQGTGLTQSMLAAAAAASSSQMTAQDAAAMTRLGRLLSSPAAAAAGGNRASLDSAISMAMARTALLGGSSASGQSQSDMRRSSMSDVQRSSLDSRGRTSIESTQSQLEWASQQVTGLPETPVGMGGAFTSPLKQGGADLLAGHQPYMPGIPEGYAMPHMPHENPQWPGRASAPSGGLNTPGACDVAQLAQLSGFSFQPSPTAAAEQAGTAATAPGRWFASGQWWSLANKQGADTSSVTEGPSSGGLQSAYSSGLYASSSANAGKQAQVSGGNIIRQSNPGLLTPEKSEASAMGPGSDTGLASMLGYGV